MTVITKAITEKKADKKDQPLVDDIEAGSSKRCKRIDVEVQRVKCDVRSHYFVNRKNIHRIHVTATHLLFLVALLILVIGVIGGLYIYEQYARSQMHRLRTGWYSISYDNSNKSPYTMPESDFIIQNMSSDLSEEERLEATKKMFRKNIENFMKERFEFDLENEQYEKIDVPDFRGGRKGRFVHDFRVNMTGIIDIDGQCCFVMPLNRRTTLPPRNMYDLLQKMQDGYYEVETEVVRETMKVITPPLTDLSVIGAYIARECQDLPTYLLTKINGSSTNVVKRSISNGVFGQFAGKYITEFDILNLEDIGEYNKKSPQN
ncbi:integral membrane protein 2C [Ceratina calcarata]|uniref:Integral membrane protein 2 n=1 Tax=Ceratina calcarata TaxID=156304 RepID=A0AAJ7NBA3_9HYME|nr:integral membrane protein 2C [Ceratina calcarata]